MLFIAFCAISPTFSTSNRQSDGLPVKCLQFDWLIGVILCRDKLLGYLIKSSPELLKRMKPQHKGSYQPDGTFEEGHVQWNDKDRMKRILSK